MDEDDYDAEPLPGTRMQGLDVVILVLEAVGGVSRVAAGFWSNLTTVVCQHANWKIERRQFSERAALEIESLINGITE